MKSHHFAVNLTGMGLLYNQYELFSSKRVKKAGFLA